MSLCGMPDLPSQPTKGPGEKQRLGWQSWETVSTSGAAAQKPVEESVSPGSNVTDWWDVEADKVTTPDTSSLPLSDWAPLLPHDTGCAFSRLCMCIIADIFGGSSDGDCHYEMHVCAFAVHLRT